MWFGKSRDLRNIFRLVKTADRIWESVPRIDTPTTGTGTSKDNDLPRIFQITCEKHILTFLIIFFFKLIGPQKVETCVALGSKRM
jgi:hypothetical protein